MMKKIWMLCLSLLLLSACSSGDDVADEQMKIYKDFKEKLIINNGTLTYNIPFSYQLDVEALSDAAYSYTVIINKPLVAMRNLQVMSLEAAQYSNDKMEPTLGIFDENVYSLIPNQVDVEKGYPEGIALNGITKDKDFTIFVLIAWHDDEFSEQQKAFFTLRVVDGKLESAEQVEDEGE